jgi:hypothetical protein
MELWERQKAEQLRDVTTGTGEKRQKLGHLLVALDGMKELQCVACIPTILVRTQWQQAQVGHDYKVYKQASGRTADEPRCTHRGAWGQLGWHREGTCVPAGHGPRF